MSPAQETVSRVATTAQSVGIAGIGGASYYLYNVTRGKQFRLGLFIVNIFLAGFVGYIVGGILPQNFSLRDSFIAMSGFSAFPILSIIEAKFPSLFEKILTNQK